MSGFFRKTLSFLGFAEAEDEEEIQEDQAREEDAKKNYTKPRDYPASHIKPKRKVSLLKTQKNDPKTKVFIAEPNDLEEMQVTGENFKNDIPVIINLQKANSDLSKRIIDFCSGMTFALEGSIQKVADKVFLVTPYNVEVTSEDKELLRQKGLFNQF